MKTILNSFKKNPKTTMAGIIIGLALLFPEFKAMVQGDDVYWNIVIGGVAAVLGGGLARDADKSSEDNGVK